MTPIRPQPFGTPPRPVVEPARSDDGRLAAQRAFFAAATGKTPIVEAAAVPPVAPAARIPDPAAPAPERILRPGSLLDIRV